MKQIIKLLTIISIIFMSDTFELSAQSYEQMWSKLETFDKDDLPKQVIGQAERIYDKARKDRNFAQMLKAWEYLVEKNSDLDPDTFSVMINATDGRCFTPPTEGTAESAIYHAVMGSAFNTMKETYLSDYDEETEDKYTELAKQHFIKSIENKQLLADTSSEPYAILFTKGKDSHLYGNDMLHILTDFVLKEAELEEAERIELLSTTAQVYKNKGNRNAYTLMQMRYLHECNDASTRLHISDKEYSDRLKELLEESKDIEVGEDVALEYYDNTEMSNDENLSFLRWAQMQYPNGKMINSFRNNEADLLRPSCVTYFDNEKTILAGKPFTMEYRTKNMTELNIQIREFTGRGSDGSLRTNGKLVKEYALPVAQDEKNTLRRNSRLVVNDTLLVETTLPAGHYVVICRGNGCSNAEEFSICSMRLFTLSLPKNRTLIGIVDNESGRPIPGVTLKLRRTNGKYEERQTDRNGELIVESNTFRRVMAIRSESDITEEMYIHQIYEREQNSGESHNLRLFTDRSIYRPGQTVHVYGILYRQKGDECHVVPNHTDSVKFMDANYQAIATKEIRTNDYGSFDVDFVIPTDRMPGRYTIRTKEISGSTDIKVEEYKRPTFTVEVYGDTTAYNPGSKGYTFGDTVPVICSAKTYSNVPVQGASVKYSISTGKSKSIFPPSRWEKLSEGELTTDDNGKANIQVFLDDSMIRSIDDEEDEFARTSEVRYKVDVDVTDLAGETSSDSYIISISRQPFHLVIDMNDNPFVGLGGSIATDLAKPDSLVVHATDPTDRRIDIEGEYKFYYTKDFKKSRKDCKPVFTGTFRSGRKTRMPDLEPGSYTVIAAAYDTNRNKVTSTSVDMIIYDSRKATDIHSRGKSQPTHFDGTRLLCPSGTFSESKDAHLYFAPSDNDAYVYYYILSNDSVVHSERLTLGKSLYDITVKYRKEYGKGVKVILFYTKDGRFHSVNEQLIYEEPDKRLSLKWETFRNRLQPGQEEEWILTVRDRNGKAVSGAELLASMYDSSLDAIVNHNWYMGLTYDRYVGNFSADSNPYVSLPYSLYLQGNIKMLDTYLRTYDRLSRFIHERWRIRGLSTMKNMAVGAAPMMMAEEGFVLNDMAVMPRQDALTESSGLALQGSVSGLNRIEPKVEIRSNFGETAFFQPHLTTDSKGNAHIAFTLPESLTKWQFMGLAHTKDMDYGIISESITASKLFMIQPNMPRFVREGDSVSIPARIINQSDGLQEGTARMRLINPENDSTVFTAEVPFSVETGKTASVQFRFDATDRYPMLVCEITGVGSNFSDGERNYLPVLSSRKYITETLPFYLTPTTVPVTSAEGQSTEGPSLTLDLTTLFNGNSTTATQKRLTFEYTARPEWTLIEALEGIHVADDNDAISYAASLYANIKASQIAQQIPGLREAVEKAISDGTASTSQLTDNSSLKEILLRESPWVLDALKESRQRESMLDLFNPHLIANRIETATNKLTKLQNADGSWSWFEGMDGSYYITLTVASNLARLGDESRLGDNLSKAMDFLDREELRTFAERKKHKGSLQPDNGTMQYLYIYTLIPQRQMSKDVRRMCETYLTEMEKNIRDLTIYGRANASILLRHFGHTKSADKFLQSVIEYSVVKPGMGRHYLTDNAYYSWFDYKIPTQLAAMRAMKGQPSETLLPDMQLWLLRQKQTQMWDNPANTIDAVDFLLTTTPSATPSATVPSASAEGQSAPLTLRINNTIVPTPTDTTRFLAEQLGYVRTVVSPSVYADGAKTMSLQAQPQGLISWGAIYAQCLEHLDRLQTPAGSSLKVSTKYIVNGGKSSDTCPELHVGDKVTLRVIVTADRDMDFVQVRCQHPSCFEPTNQTSGYRWMGGRGGYLARHDASTDIFFDRYTKGTTTFDLEFTATRRGTYQTGIATVQCAYSPEYAGHSKGSLITVR